MYRGNLRLLAVVLQVVRLRERDRSVRAPVSMISA